MTKRILGIATALALTLAACGSSDDKGSDDTSASSEASASASETTEAPSSDDEGSTSEATDDDSSSEATDDTGSGEPVKAAWIFVGPINDGGWTTAHNEGRLTVEENLGDKVITTYKENVPEGPEVAQVIEDLVKDGNKIIFAASFGYGDAMIAAAEKYPDVKFEWATGFGDTPDNFSTYFGAGEESLYLTGMAAGAVTKSNIVGFVAPFPIPEVIRHINAYELGMQRVNPDAQLRVIWVNSWFDPAKERQAAESLISSGADVIANGGDSPAPGEAAKAAGVKWTGYDSDQSQNFPEIWLTAAVYDWGPYYTSQVEAVMNGTWEKDDYYGNMSDGFTDIAPMGKSVPAEAQEEINKVRQEIIDGTFDIFSGPIYDQSGTERVAEGEAMDFGTQMSIDWFVQGVDGDASGG